MNIIIAPDSFKGSLTAFEASDIIEKEIHKKCPDAVTACFPMADGGEGTMDILADLCRGRIEYVKVHGPSGEITDAPYAVINDDTAVIEMAKASGLMLISEDRRNPEKTSTFGTGELIKDALDKGMKKFLICLGGSATNDGGTGALAALGIRFLNAENGEIEPRGEELINISRIDVSGLYEPIKKAEFHLLCDVTNPLTGPFGATAYFSEQKGADEEMKERLEAGMQNYAEILRQEFSFDPQKIPGSGAAGGLTAGLMCFLNCSIVSGIDEVIKVSGLEEYINGENADIIISGEGRADRQSVNGKVLSGIGRVAVKNGLRAFALAGCLQEGYESLYELGFEKILSLKTDDMTAEYAMRNAQMLLAERTGQLLEELL